MSPHKVSHYVAYMTGEIATPEQAQAVLEFLDNLPPVQSFDDWWEAIVRQCRERVKHDLMDEFGPSCECCEARPATDLHELVPRSSDTTWRQIFLFTRENCALVCRECHQSPIYSDEFKERIRQRRC